MANIPNWVVCCERKEKDVMFPADHQGPCDRPRPVVSKQPPRAPSHFPPGKRSSLDRLVSLRRFLVLRPVKQGLSLSFREEQRDPPDLFSFLAHHVFSIAREGNCTRHLLELTSAARYRKLGCDRSGDGP